MALRSAFGLWPTWLPDNAIDVGDFGHVVNGVFVRDGMIGTFGATVRTRSAKPIGQQTFSSRSVSTRTVGAGAAAGAEAFARITFGRSFGAYLALDGCAERRATDLGQLAKELAEVKAWSPESWLVTGVVRAEAALIAVSSGRGGSLELKISNVAAGIVAELKGGAQIVHESGLGFRFLGGPCTPLFRLARLTDGDELMLRGRSSPAVRLVEIDARVGLEPF